MTLDDDVSAVLPGLRVQAESRMRESVLVGTFEDGADEVTGDPIRVPVSVSYEGRGRIRWASRDVTTRDAPGMPLAVQEPYLSVPFGTSRLAKGEEVLCVASDDPLLVGRRFSIQGSAAAGQVSAYRYPLIELG